MSFRLADLKPISCCYLKDWLFVHALAMHGYDAGPSLPAFLRTAADIWSRAFTLANGEQRADVKEGSEGKAG